MNTAEIIALVGGGTAFAFAVVVAIGFVLENVRPRVGVRCRHCGTKLSPGLFYSPHGLCGTCAKRIP